MWEWLKCIFVTALFGTVLPIEVPLNVFIGTGKTIPSITPCNLQRIPQGGEGYGVGSNPPGAQIPFGMMRLSPDTSYDNIAVEWNHFGGYYYGNVQLATIYITWGR